MKNIMLIAVATLTIATANADGYNWSAVHPVQIVNQTPVTLVFRTEPDGAFFTLNPGQSTYASNVGDTAFYVAWQYGTQNANIIKTQGFDDSQQQGTLGLTSVAIQGNIDQGQAWALYNVAYDDTIVFSSTPNGMANTMQLIATRVRGITVVRVVTGTNDNELTDIFCLDTGVEFGLGSGASGRCPIGETQVLIGDDFELLQANPSRDWSATWLISNIYTTCTYAGSCSVNSSYNVAGEYINEFDSVPYSSSSNSHIELELQGE